MRPVDNKTRRVLSVIADRGPATRSLIAHVTRLSPRDVGHKVSQEFTRGRISRVKPKLSEGGGYYRYFMTDEQRAAFQHLTHGAFRDGVLLVDAADVPARLRFLEMLKERTVYGDHAVLAAIIEDYQRTLKALLAQ